MHAQLGPSFEKMMIGDRPLSQHHAHTADAWAADFSEKESEAWYWFPYKKLSESRAASLTNDSAAGGVLQGGRVQSGANGSHGVASRIPPAIGEAGR
jgi:hypothetical protein